ncbi:MAG: chromosomal replication initiator protein DnaA [Candidatus Vogelbacteria bacterium CG10_big_fil_rev_8_21_14_0_10_51_16]|uniref:Chromosomal replication initiator protein DnaA n=1 Tax=Candidatus Vogelbacteria bacterium CG10_big_fil_rev_8_21_14_0_10_51_16 TaxID=1975045 RepID=A0A2H0RDV6_9BACT|nr:MAG: chromosomal replication initiator protein DnaA [Candidatus Vogelbacteria bacterium CG10_big_fil_rev_8_21_14_0_10_51_16]
MPPIIENKKLWDDVITQIELGVSKANFNTWFKNTYISRQEDGIIHLAVPNDFVKEWIFNKYHKFILKILRDSNPAVRNVEYVIHKEQSPARQNELERAQMEELFSSQMRLQELAINKEDNLNPRYTFDSLIVGGFNELAHAAAHGVVRKPGVMYNPLFIYGGTGLGKTHLIQSIGNELKKTGESKKVYYLGAEKYTVDLIDSLQNNKMTAFKERYKKYDLLIIDDIQFIAGKDRTQEEFFHLFNSYHDNNKQIIFSSDKPPKHIADLEDRLRSRFEGGMMVDISRPEYEARLAILKAKLKQLNFSLQEETVEYIASSIQDNIRELEGALNSVVCQSQLKKRNLGLTEVKTLIKNSIRPQRTISAKDVIQTVAAFFNIEEKVIYEKSRRKEIVKPRQIAMYILREDFNTSYPYIGQKLGGRDHTTVMHAYEKIKRDLKSDQMLGQEMEQIKSMLYNEYPVSS